MAVWVPSEGYHRQIVSTLREVQQAGAARLPLAEFRALPAAQRRQQWFATWTPYRVRSQPEQRAWTCLMELLADGQWWIANEVRECMVEAMGVGDDLPLDPWRRTYQLIRNGVFAGGLEEQRIHGSWLLTHRLVRRRADCPTRLLPPDEREGTDDNEGANESGGAYEA